ncbi:HtaA domain-containing protein [Arthrobacter sp. W4I7]|uniref:HtaA domain-containing protein n=1 Tax=Arthrobacter sp. W4I7 TaxID=3042296 RepID=UPI002788797A|nr:HtaA domain-containing protein [Arthrobacter sp. W4I7]MDQ0691440.1 hypothetical protein [Arthrobacter sp. W4I7]
MEQQTTDTPPPGFHWGIKEGFVRYIARMGDGICSTTDGADISGKKFLFSVTPSQSENPPEPQSFAFIGDVRFSGHHGLLFVRIADPTLAITGDTAVLSVVDYLDQQEGKRLDLATACIAVREDPTTGVRILNGTDVRLTADGTELFNNVYPEGEPFDDFEAHIPARKGLSL